MHLSLKIYFVQDNRDVHERILKNLTCFLGSFEAKNNQTTKNGYKIKINWFINFSVDEERFNNISQFWTNFIFITHFLRFSPLCFMWSIRIKGMFTQKLIKSCFESSQNSITNESVENWKTRFYMYLTLIMYV